jgi:membrane-bound ClpP family serine protease
MIIGLGIITLALALLFPRFMRGNALRIKNEFTKTLIIGLVASFLVPMISIGLVLTLVGIPLVFFIMIAWLFGALLSGPIAAFYIGQMVLRNRKNASLIAVVGSVVLVTASYLPVAGVLIVMLAYWLGFGALIQALRAHMHTAEDDDTEVDAHAHVEHKHKAKTSKKK